MGVAVQENLIPCSAQSRSRAANGEPATIGASPQWFGTTSIAIRSRHGAQQIEQPVHLAFEARRDVMHRREQEAVLAVADMLRDCAIGALDPLTKLHLRFSGAGLSAGRCGSLDVCAFYSPAGGGVRTYVEAKLRAAARSGTR